MMLSVAYNSYFIWDYINMGDEIIEFHILKNQLWKCLLLYVMISIIFISFEQ